MREYGVVSVGLLGIGLWAGAVAPARAASFDCAKAKAAIEVAICATPALNTLDDRLKIALDGALKRAGDSRAGVLADHRKWLAETPKSCGLTLVPASDPILACLTQAYEKQIAALNPPTAAATAQTPPTPAAPPQPGPAVTLEATQLPAAGRQTTYLALDAPAWVTVKAQSATGVALRLVDMIAGPLGSSGVAGERDGRLDVLLDRGRYKLILTGAEAAPDQVTLTATSAAELHPAAPPLAQAPGETLAASLGDGQQRSYWIAVGTEPVALMAAGRALADMRLWRDGTDLADLISDARLTDLEPGKSQRVLSLRGKLPPGRYKLTLYGGAPLRWPDGSAEMPLALRSRPLPLAALDLRSGTIGPMGIEQFVVPPGSDFTRLELPAVAPVRLLAQAMTAEGDGREETTAITKLNRRPLADLSYPAGAQGTLVTVEGIPGQAYSLAQLARLTETETRLQRQPADRLLTLLDPGTASGGFPLSAVLTVNDKPVASATPVLSESDILRTTLTLDGRQTVLFEVTAAARFRVKSQGVPHFWSIGPAGWGEPLSGNPIDLEPGYYRLSLRPSTALTGPATVELAGEAADSTTPVPPPAAPRLVSMLVPATPPNSYATPILFTAERAGLPTGFAVYDLPLQPAAGAPVLFGLAPGASQTLPLALAAAGTLVIGDDAGKPVAFQLDGKPATGRVALTAGAHKLDLKNPGTTALGLRIGFEARAAAAPEAATPANAPPPANPRLTAGQTYALDLAATPRRFDVLVEEPGLYRFETHGRLALRATLKTRLLPRLALAAENGPGHNAVLERYLRAGLYQLDLAALDNTKGRTQLSLSRAPLAEGERLHPGIPVRVGLAPGAGAALPLTLEKPGRYALHLLSLAEPVAFRLEDAEGWPILPASQRPEPFGAAGSLLSVELPAGDYRLVLIPPALPARAVIRLTPEAEPPALSQGHGPHPLALNGTQDFRWLEPAQPEDPRTPDQWEFALPGPTRLKLALTDGMAGEVRREEDGQFIPVGTVSAALPFDATVAGGRYRLAVSALARNNRLGYRLTSATEELLPDQPRRVTLPSRQSFSLDTPQTVRLASYGLQDVKAVLRDAAGRIVAQADDRLNDWNFVIVRALPAGRYSLTVDAVTPPPPGVDPSAEPESDGRGESYETESEQAEAAAEAPDETAEPAPQAELADGAVDLSLTYLPETAAAPLTLSPGKPETVTLASAQTLLPLTLGSGALVIEAAPGGEALLSLERQNGAQGAWDTIGQATGAAPRLVFLPEGKTYRLRIIALGGTSTRKVTLRQLDLAAQALAEPLRFTALDGSSLTAARLAVPGGAALDLGAGATGLLGLSGADALARPLGSAILLPQGEDVWLLRPTPETAVLTAKPLTPAPDAPLMLRPEGPIRLTVPPEPGDKLVLWQADAPQGQPVLALGGAMGLATGSALAIGPETRLRLNSLGPAPMPLVGLTRHLLDKPAQTEARTGAVSASVPARGSLDLRLAVGAKRLTLDLPAGVAAQLDGAPLLGHGDRPSAHRLESNAERLRLYNLTSAPAQVALRQMPENGPRLAVTGRQSFKQFLPAAGSLLLTVEGLAGQTLRVAGGASAVWYGRDGQVSRGARLAIAGPGVLALDHPAGLLAVWLDGPGAGLWPDTPLQSVTLPQTLALSGPAQALRLNLTEPGLLHLRSTAPVIAGLHGAADDESIRLFPTGADWHRYLPAGPVDLRLAAPQDGSLTGSLDLAVSPVTPVQDGLSAPVPLAAGESRAFVFTMPRAGKIGVGVRALRDPAAVRLLDAKGVLLGEGLVQYRDLQPGLYVLEVAAPADETLSVQAAIVGIAAPDRGPPPDVRQRYVELVGLRPHAP